MVSTPLRSRDSKQIKVLSLYLNIFTDYQGIQTCELFIGVTELKSAQGWQIMYVINCSTAR